ncbi:glycosyltransferase family 2 protein [Limosilactobacillus caecicola]|uniref:glycosyltransferase family 2 protein n=1 Tax=Limosilactobacillus caecicola TaxID=2941332 RepID=UPI002041A92F|nr:glycosyltransferase family 2 protein [Limosilactobacillus caecicola]
MATISVIIPVYNCAPYLERCLDSVVNQSFRDLEIILVNDGSTDNSLAICQQYRAQDQRIKVIAIANQGVSAARNTGVKIASAELITFIDSDDWFSNSNAIQTLYDTMTQTGAEIVVGNFDEFNEADNSYHLFTHSNQVQCLTPHEWFQNEYAGQNNLSQCFSTPWAKLYPKKVLTKCPYPEGMVDEDDLTNWKLYLQANQIAFIDTAVYVYRNNRKSSITSSTNWARLFSLPAMDQRITMEQAIGFQDIIEQNRNAVAWRMAIHYNNALQIGETANYKNARLKQQIIDKYHH